MCPAVSRFSSLFILLPLLTACAHSTPGSKSEPAETSAAKLNMQLGIAYMQQGNFDVALDKLNKALERDGRLPEAHNAIALLYEGTGRPNLAEQHFQRAIELDANYTLAKLNYAQFLCTHGQPAAGEDRFLAIARNPPVGSTEPASTTELAAKAYTGAAVCALATDRRRADNYLRQALALKPDAGGALYQMANLYYADGDYLKARAFLQRYHAQAGYTPESLWLGISIEDKLGGSPLRQEYTQILLSKFADSDVARRLKSK
jgi:type IV pilus assembly protein PilF